MSVFFIMNRFYSKPLQLYTAEVEILFLLAAELCAHPEPEAAPHHIFSCTRARIECIIETALDHAREVLVHRDHVAPDRGHVVDAEARVCVEPVEAVVAHPELEVGGVRRDSGRRAAAARIAPAVLCDVRVYEVVRDVRGPGDRARDAVAAVLLIFADVVLDEGVTHFSLLDHEEILHPETTQVHEKKHQTLK